MLRTLTLKSTMTFGKYPTYTVYSILFALEQKDYLRWVYFNMSNINFNDEIMELIGITERIEKPGKNPELFTNLPKKVYERKELTVAEASILKACNKKRIRERAKARLVKQCKQSSVSKGFLMNVNRNLLP